MAATPGMKSQGMKFAEEQLQRHGWTEGKGLGKTESGISEAIKVKVKCDSAGVGHNSAEQFTFHWWDHVFNKTASGIAVEPDEDGVQVKKVTDEDSSVTNKKPRKALANQNMLYGRFIKSATLLSGGEKPVEKESSSDSSEDEDEKLDLSSATKVTDDDLVKICGGRTAHKGARHGLTMSAKLLRIEEQERAFLEKYGKKKPAGEPGNGLLLEKEAETGRKEEKSRSDVSNEDDSSNSTQWKKKKKRKVKDEDILEEGGTNGSEEHVPGKEDDTRNEDLEDALSGVDEDTARGLDGQLIETDLKSSKKKKKKAAREKVIEEAEDHARSTEDDVRSSKKKKRKAKEDKDEGNEELLNGNQEDGLRLLKKKKKKVEEEDEGTKELLNGPQEWPPLEDHRLLKKKKKKAQEEDEGTGELLNRHEEWAPSERSKKKKKSSRHQEEWEESAEEHVQSAQKKEEEVDVYVCVEEEQCRSIKKKKNKNKYRDSPTPEEEQGRGAESTEHRSKSKKKKSS